jgi:prevent-host-death family protein
MQTTNVHEAKTHFSKLLERVSKGEEIIIAKSGAPVARLIPYSPGARKRQFGKDSGLFEVPEDFDAPLPDDFLALFEA